MFDVFSAAKFETWRLRPYRRFTSRFRTQAVTRFLPTGLNSGDCARSVAKGVELEE